MSRPTVTVMIVRERDPLQGQRLRVLGRMRRGSGVELLVVLADGSKRLVPAAWTDLDQPGSLPAEATASSSGLALGSVTDLLRACTVVAGLAPGPGPNGSRLHDSHLPRRTIVQPVQLSLLPETCPAPSATLSSSPSLDRSGMTARPPSDLPATPMMPLPPLLPEGPVAAAVGLMGRLIAEAAAHAITGRREAGDE
jgi:Family of unknown function (DUF5372)